jgi:HD-GYP domain-containing protein (c-di-GMP phosphodiesterase class II)
MQLTTLSTVKHRIRVGEPLPFDVHDADRTLLLARGQRVGTPEQLQALLERGALVDVAELQTARQRLQQVPRGELPRHWAQCMSDVGQALRQTPREGFQDALDDAAAPVVALIERDPDLAIFQVLRQEGGDRTAYGARRSVQCAITAYLVAQRLGWDAAGMDRVFKVALTMNVSMLELQGQLAFQRTPPSAEQLAALQSHPLRSVQMLELAGVRDVGWLQAVARHHEVEQGGGYPTGRGDVGDLASLARRADVYTAKLATRSHRDALAADVAGRQMFMEDPGHPMTAALVKEFGIYPPGCCVRLTSGAVGIVVERGPTLTSPIVACLTGPDHAALPAPVRVDTSQREHAVVGIVSERRINVQVTAEKLMALLAIR